MGGKLNQIYNIEVNPVNIRQLVFPIVTGIGTGVVATAGAANVYGVWVDVILLAGITQPSLIKGVNLDTPSAGAIFTIQIGSCAGFATAAALNAGGAPAIAAAGRAETRIEVATDAGGYVHAVLSPIYIPAGVGIVARISTVAGATTAGISVTLIQGF